MAKIDKHIKIICAARPGLSIMSQEAMTAIHAVLSDFYERVDVSLIDDLADLQQLILEKPDLVFLGMKYLPLNHALGKEDPNKIWVSQYLDEQGIAYTGSSQPAIELELSKPLAKQCVLDAGLQTLNFFTANSNDYPTERPLPLLFPVFIKPVNMGGGQGIDSNSVAHTFSDFQAKVQEIADTYNSESLVEEYLPGREFSVAILEKTPGKLTVMPIELVAAKNTQGNRILTQKVKRSNTEKALSIQDGAIKRTVMQLAASIFEVLGARDYGRIDIRLDRYGNPQFLEANLVPSLGEGYGSFPKACLLNQGMSYKTMILSIVRVALERGEEAKLEALRPSYTSTLPVKSS